jgi:antitoxin CcdA
MDKVTIEVAIRRDLLEEAETLDISVPQALEEAVRAKVSAEKARRWREENAEAIAFNNKELEANGLWSDGLRLF